MSEKKLKRTGSKPDRAAGGAATAGGMNFQAAVTAIAFVQIARGRPLGWLPGVAVDVPAAIEAETGGPGDDIRIVLTGGETVEAQVKKGLQRGKKLWEALTALAVGIGDGSINFGLLLVCPQSSQNIRKSLARDIVRLGDGQTDGLTDIGSEWLAILRDCGLSPQETCGRLRVVTVAALDSDDAAIHTAQAELGHLCAAKEQIIPAWNALYKDAASMIERRGRRDVTTLLRILRAEKIVLRGKAEAGPAALLDRVTRWNFEAHSTFSIIGSSRILDIDKDWIELSAVIRKDVPPEDSANGNLEDAISAYHRWERLDGGTRNNVSSPETLGRFIKRGIIIAGPGFGKSTLLKRIVRRYSDDGIPVLRVRLSAIAASMRMGVPFEDAVFRHGLDGSGVAKAEVRSAGWSNWLLLGDGLDECGDVQEQVADAVERFAIGFPDSRILVTTRPVGYRASHFTHWRHYDLAPLDISYAHRNVAKLLDALTDNTSVDRDSVAVCERELENGEIREIVGRTPLLVGLAAAILASGRGLGDTREALFEQVFALVDDIPRRSVEKPAPDFVLSRFLDVLGWHLTERPLLSCGKMIELCATTLAQETGDPLLKAVPAVESYVAYWEDVGLIEKVGLSGTSVYCFIHKSLGEFAAARRLCSLPPEEQRQLAIACVTDAKWNEVMRFAGMLGLANLVARTIIELPASSAGQANRLVYAIRLLTEATTSVDSEIRKLILDQAFTRIETDAGSDAVHLGIPLISVARQFPLEMVPRVLPLRKSPHARERLLAWNCLIAAGADYYDLDELIASVEENIASRRQALETSLGGGVMLTSGESFDLAERLALGASVEIHERASAGSANELIPRLLGNATLGSIRFLREAEALIKENGWSYKIEWPGTRFPDFMRSEIDWDDAQRVGDLFLLDAIGASDFTEPLDGPIGPLLNLSAFVQMTNMGEVPASDAWAWTKPFDPNPAQATIKMFAEISGLDLRELAEEAKKAKRAILASDQTPSEGWWRYRLYHSLDEVDPPEVDWSKVRSLNADPKILESAIKHPSSWIVWIAANLLENVLRGDALAECVARLYAEGSRNELWAAAGMATELPPAEAIRLTLDRLAKPHKPGCHHLYNLLIELKPAFCPKLFNALKAGLLSPHVTTAVAASSLLELVVQAPLKGAQRDELKVLTGEAYAHWLEHEEPYPVRGGAIPDSPRAKLAKILMQLSPATRERANTYLSDSRSDVADVGKLELAAWLQASSEYVDAFLDDVEAGVVKPHMLGWFLKGQPDLSEAQVERIEKLLLSSSESMRFNAMDILTIGKLDSGAVGNHLTRLSTDNHRQIRDRAARLRATEAIVELR